MKARHGDERRTILAHGLTGFWGTRRLIPAPLPEPKARGASRIPIDPLRRDHASDLRECGGLCDLHVSTNPCNDGDLVPVGVHLPKHFDAEL